jgi:hypothetical protein
LPVKKGDLVVIHGSIDHLSLPNYSNKSRHSFQVTRRCSRRVALTCPLQLHLVEGPKEGVIWSPENWLQYKENRPFPEIVPRQESHHAEL